MANSFSQTGTQVQTQTQTLTPQQLLVSQLTEMPVEALYERVDQELKENTALERETEDYSDGESGYDEAPSAAEKPDFNDEDGIRASELGDCGMEYDEKTPEQQAEICNVVRLAINRSQFSKQHIEYVASALIALYRDRDQIPNMRLTFGKGIPMRHFHMWLEPYAPKKEELCDEANYPFWAEWEKDREAKLKKWGLK